MKNSPSIVLKSLLYGMSVELEKGYVFRLFSPGEAIKFPSGEHYSEEYFLAIEMEQNNQKVYIGANLDLTEFIELTEKLENDTLVLMSAANVLKEIKED